MAQMQMQARIPSTGVSAQRMRAIFVVCVLVVLGLAVESGIQAVTGGSKLLFIVPLAAVGGIGLVVLGIVNFEAFALTTIVLRASMDIAKPSTDATTAGTGSAGASGLDPAGALAVLFMIAALAWWLARRSAALTSPPPSVHRVALIVFTATGFLSIIGSAFPMVTFLEAI